MTSVWERRHPACRFPIVPIARGRQDACAPKLHNGHYADLAVSISRRTLRSRCFNAKPGPPRLASGAITQY